MGLFNSYLLEDEDPDHFNLLRHGILSVHHQQVLPDEMTT